MQTAYEPSAVYTDLTSLTSLRAQAKTDRNAAIKTAAKQFESMFLQMMLKQMRAASFGDPIFDSQASDTYRSMFDQQLALNLSERGSLGIAKLIERQLGADTGNVQEANPFNFNTSGINRSGALPAQQPVEVGHGVPAHPEPVQPTTDQPGMGLDAEILLPGAFSRDAYKGDELFPHIALHTAPRIDARDLNEIEPGEFITDGVTRNTAIKRTDYSSPAEFVEDIWPHAERAAKELGVPTEAIVSQAALETGWGKFIMHRGEGASSFNLFGIKADHRWHGDRVSVPTTEYRDGVVQRERASFRAYDSYEEAFSDYVGFLKNSGRYDDALDNSGNADKFLAGLQAAGYATDPQYASKIGGILRSETFASARAGLAN